MPSRALVPVEAADPASLSRTTTQRPSAVFLAQLIAVRANFPQARERRRAEPHEAIAAYTATLKRAA
jgi:hypothetical protein